MEKKQQFKSIRPFIGANNFKESRNFYTDLGFKELVLSEKMSYFTIDKNFGFYLQDYAVKDWIDNSMLFVEVEDLQSYLSEIKAKNLTEKYPKVRLSEIVEKDWGNEFFIHDSSGILWHFGNFKN